MAPLNCRRVTARRFMRLVSLSALVGEPAAVLLGWLLAVVMV